MDTIFALSSAQGKAGVAVIRVSGTHAFDVCEAFVGGLPSPRMACLRELRFDGELLDQALVLIFEEGHSFTGEKTVEFQVHGSVAVVERLSGILASMRDVRPAEPGEFTRRALENERLDIAQIEGLSDLLASETELQRRQAMRGFSGELGNLCDAWRKALINAMALLEVTIDFSDEDVPETTFPEVQELIDGVISELDKQLAGVLYAERIRSGFEVAIVGAPNAGKSTLLNALAGRDAAITSEIAGTTRDVIEVRMNLGGLPVTILDTAGLRETNDAIETLGIERALQRAENADLRVFLVEGRDDFGKHIQPEDILRLAKCDVAEGDLLGISGRTGEGIPELVAEIVWKLKPTGQVDTLATRQRHKGAMTEGRRALKRGRDLMIYSPEHSELVAEEVRKAIQALDSLVGRVDVEHVLDEIFANFCLGK